MRRAPRHRSCGSALDRQSLALRLAVVVALALLVGATAGAGSGAPSLVTLTVVVHGEGRVTTEPPTALDCPGACSLVVAASAVITLRGTPAAGHELTERFNCFVPSLEDPTCTVDMHGFDQRVDVYFAPAAELQLWPAGHGDLSVEPAGTEHNGEPASPLCEESGISTVEGCVRRYVPGTTVVVTAHPKPGSSFTGWSGFRCPGTGSCTVTVRAPRTSVVGRFSPLPLNVNRGGNGTGRVVSEPPGVACPPTCSGVHFPAGTVVTLVAQPDPAFPFVSWKFGCTVSAADPHRCTVKVVSNPQWVGVAIGEDDTIGVPSVVSVLFEVAPAGRGQVRGGGIDCGERCSGTYTFGRPETLDAVPSAGWRFTRWLGACEPRPRCTLLVGPVTSLGVTFTENLAPKLLSLTTRRRAGVRQVVVRVGTAHAATAVVRMRRVGASAGLPAKTYAVHGGTTTLVRAVGAARPAGRYRIVVALSDGRGGGRTFTRIRKLGAP